MCRTRLINMKCTVPPELDPITVAAREVLAKVLPRLDPALVPMATDYLVTGHMPAPAVGLSDPRMTYYRDNITETTTYLMLDLYHCFNCRSSDAAAERSRRLSRIRKILSLLADAEPDHTVPP